MPTPVSGQAQPYNVPGGETNLDTTTPVDGNVEINVTLKLVGTVSQVQADWATLLGTTLQSNAVQSHD